MDYKHHKEDTFRQLLSAPFIYGMLPVLVALDFFFEIYHHVAFRLYRLPRVKRSEYIRIDRQKLQYLNLFDKVNCMYCGYGNGLLRYAGAIAAATEAYWCGIQHQKNKRFREQEHQKDFLPYGDEQAFRKKYKK